MQPGFDRGQSYTKAGRDLVQRQVGVVVQKDGEPISSIQLGQRIDEGGIVLRTLRRLGGLLEFLVSRGRHALAPVVDGRIRGELPEPRLEWTGRVEAGKDAQELPGDLLGPVLRLVEIPEAV